MGTELEKRNFHRLEFPLDVAVRIVPAKVAAPPLPTLPMKTRNISTGGICLETNSLEVEGIHLLTGAPFARENRLEMAIHLLTGAPPLEARGEVRWYDVARDIPGCLYLVGVAFLDLTGDGKEQIARFLKKQGGQRGFFQRLLSPGE